MYAIKCIYQDDEFLLLKKNNLDLSIESMRVSSMYIFIRSMNKCKQSHHSILTCIIVIDIDSKNNLGI